MGAGKVIESILEAVAKEAPKAKKAAKPFFPVGSDERAANLENFFGDTHPNFRQRYYTGTSKDRDFTSFQESRHGTWLTSNPSEASDYALQNDSMNLRPIPGSWSYERVNSASRVIPSHARVTNPYTGELPDFARAENYKKAQSDWFDTLRAQGYDAWAPESRKGDLLVVLKDQGTNVKSAVGNNGAFDRTKKHMGYAGGGIVRELIEKVAKEAPEVARGNAARRAMINIGLDINGGERLSPDQVLEVLGKMGVKPVRAVVHQSDTEPTLVVELERSLKPDEAHLLSDQLRQEAIAQVDETGAGDLYGPAAEKWKPFNGDYFIDPSGKRLTQAIMDAGSGEKPGFGVGGIVREAAERLLGQADEVGADIKRLYHGTTKLPNRVVGGQVDYGDGSKGFDFLDPDVRNNQLGLHLGTKPQADYFASDNNHLTDADILLNKEYYATQTPDGGRVIPLDVKLKNPVRLEDRVGSWYPSEVYSQLVEQGKLPDDKQTWEMLKDYESSPQPQDRKWAQDFIRKQITDLGHDGAVYTNRVEGFATDDDYRSRFTKRGIHDTSGLKDDEWLDVVPEAKGNDSYIVWDKDQYKSPFGDGPGVGFADGGPVQKFDKGGIARKLGSGLIDLLDFSGVAGKPRTVKIPGEGSVVAAPIKEIDDAAEGYMKKAGIPGTHRIGEYPEFDQDFAKKIADQFEMLKHDPNNPEVRRAYEALLDETLGQYKALKDTGLDVKFLKDGMDDPYAASPSMGYADMVKNGRLWVFPTSQGYGSGADVLEHPLLKKVGKVGDLEDATANDAFRVVHDAYGHFGPGNPFFRAPGEDRAWQHHARMYSDDALPAMSAETRGQNSWVNFGPKARENAGASGADTVYADQKAVAMPSWVYERDLGRKPKFAEGGSVLSDEDIASMTHDHSYGVGSKNSTLKAFGEDIDLGSGPVYYRNGEEYAPKDNVQDIYDMKTLPFYATPAAPVAAASDFTEGMLSGDPLTMALAVAGGIPGRAYKEGAKIAAKVATNPLAAAGAAGTVGMTAGSDDAEAGVFGRAAKWAMSGEGKDALNMAIKMSSKGASNGETFASTGWFKDVDGHWKFWRSSQGGGLIEPLKGRRLADVYNDPFLFDEYPHMKDIGFRRKNDEGAHWDTANNEIVLGDTSKPGYNTPDAGGRYGAVTHEVYHGKSEHEGWPQGTSVMAAAGQVGTDMKRFAGMPKGTPERNVGNSFMGILQSQNYATDIARLGFKRYENEVGEVLARREAAIRELGRENFGRFSPDHMLFLDTDPKLTFHPGQNASPETYRAILELIEQRRVADDMAAAAAKPQTKRRR